MTIGYYPDHSYKLRRLNDDDGLDPIPAFYLVRRDLYPAQQLLPQKPEDAPRFQGRPVGRVELNNSLLPYQVLAGTEVLGQIELSEGIYTTVEGQRYLLQLIPL
ncbi:hypothetical protein [Pseudomonas sp.]|uniref:hypothetical protein n=1 Tax=Pseudomonas sp. TaxID=306 RepID=UPI00291583F6|nr:hypothetical protein [Pseudomonas sp.]MDU4254496.1 hypothetical protein [Pseudomonas sp.]